MNSSRVTGRPLRIYFLVLLVVGVIAWNGLRLGETIFFWKTLEEYGAHPLYIAVSGGVWVVTGLLLVQSLWLGKAWGWAASLGGSVGYLAWYWFDRLVLQKPHANWLFVLIVQIVFSLIIFIILFSRKTKQYFKRDSNERKYKNSTIT